MPVCGSVFNKSKAQSTDSPNSLPELMATLITVFCFIAAWEQESFIVEQSMCSLVVISPQPAEIAKILCFPVRGLEMFDSSLPSLRLKQINSHFLSLPYQIVKTTAGADISCRVRKNKTVRQ